MGTDLRAKSAESAAIHSPPRVQAMHFNDDGLIPNNELPLLVYKGAFRLGGSDPASFMEQVFEANGWGSSWRDGVYPYHHYHSTAHEVLGVYAGSATVQFGGEHGASVLIKAGDAVVIPAGVAHKDLGSSGDFGVVGAYPGGQEWDMCYGKAQERPNVDQWIAQVPLPEKDPIYGEGGPLREHWRR